MPRKKQPVKRGPRLKTAQDVARYIARTLRAVELGTQGEGAAYRKVMMGNLLLAALKSDVAASIPGSKEEKVSTALAVAFELKHGRKPSDQEQGGLEAYLERAKDASRIDPEEIMKSIRRAFG